MPQERLRKLVVATHNRKKAGEMIQILSKRFPGVEFLTLADYPNAPEPEETGMTYAENASIKALSAAKATGEWSLADDAGLEIDAMGGEPGLHSKRFEGEETPFPEKMRRILERMKDTPEAERDARFRCCVVLASGDGNPTVFEATCEGRIALAPSGVGGFGYDPIFFLPEQGCTMADLTAEEKHAISHRGKVLKMAGDYLTVNFKLPEPDAVG
ncbi:MAG TPA: RdgB/HAM1 family non-canonical purine NTP pyrophosphatase [Fimbriimonadaceae bacterium]|nr:RdgB/HAM1 family non-canonical purine NTP pyrophosphatase [Fimbriimonadaceae bacterium]